MEFFVMPLSDQLLESFSDLTDREIQIACRFALEIIKGIAWFPLPVGVGENPFYLSSDARHAIGGPQSLEQKPGGMFVYGIQHAKAIKMPR